MNIIKIGVYLWGNEILNELNSLGSSEEVYERIGLSLEFKDILAQYEMEEVERRLREEEQRIEEVEKRKLINKKEILKE